MGEGLKKGVCVNVVSERSKVMSVYESFDSHSHTYTKKLMYENRDVNKVL